MSLFNRNNNPNPVASDQTLLAEMALKSINDGVIITDKNGLVKFINPAAITMTESTAAAVNFLMCFFKLSLLKV